MAERYTSVCRVDGGEVFVDFGRLGREEAIERMRETYRRDKEYAEQMLALSDEDLVVKTHTGAYVWRNVKIVEPKGDPR